MKLSLIFGHFGSTLNVGVGNGSIGFVSFVAQFKYMKKTYLMNGVQCLFVIVIVLSHVWYGNSQSLRGTERSTTKQNYVKVVEKAVYVTPTGGPAFLTFLPRNSIDGKVKNIIVSTFDGIPYVRDFVYLLQNVDETGKAKWIALNRTSDLYWPNEPFYVSPIQEGTNLQSLFGKYGSVLIPSGFLVPSKNYGAIYQYTFQSDPSLNSSSLWATLKPILNTNQRDGNEWFYHRVRYVLT